MINVCVVQQMSHTRLDERLLERLSEVPEIELCNFTVRRGLFGTGVTVLRERTYFGSWRLINGALAWTSSYGEQNYKSVDDVEEAVRYTLLMVLRNLESSPEERRELLAARKKYA